MSLLHSGNTTIQSQDGEDTSLIKDSTTGSHYDLCIEYFGLETKKTDDYSFGFLEESSPPTSVAIEVLGTPCMEYPGFFEIPL
jgi:hypothetical protein